MNRGYFGIGIEKNKSECNLGTLWRSAHILGASFIFTIGRRYKRQASDTTKAIKHVPYYDYSSFDDFYTAIPFGCRLIGVELDANATPIENFIHPERCAYLLGAEDHGLSKKALEYCTRLIVLPGEYSLNVATVGSIVMYDRKLPGKVAQW